MKGESLSGSGFIVWMRGGDCGAEEGMRTCTLISSLDVLSEWVEVFSYSSCSL